MNHPTILIKSVVKLHVTLGKVTVKKHALFRLIYSRQNFPEKSSFVETRIIEILKTNNYMLHDLLI